MMSGWICIIGKSKEVSHLGVGSESAIYHHNEKGKQLLGFRETFNVQSFRMGRRVRWTNDQFACALRDPQIRFWIFLGNLSLDFLVVELRHSKVSPRMERELECSSTSRKKYN
jgi:hypothetical protein